MKKILSILTLAGLALVLFASCNKDTAPQDTDLFIGTYNGSLKFVSDDETIIKEDGKVTVTKVGDVYNFAFSDGIPNINNIKFEADDDEYYINIGGSGTSYIRINKDKLKILYLSDGKTWTADCTR